MQRISVIILAAGQSARMGEPKQLLDFHGQSLIQRAATAASQSTCQPAIVVVGAYADRIQAELELAPVAVALNPDWESGIGSSISTGLQALLQLERAGSFQSSGVLIMLGDQPFVTTEMLNELGESFSILGGIIASYYAGTLGVPAIFAREFFPELLSLSGNYGAKSLIELHRDRMHAIDFPAATIDIDTKKDYAELVGGLVRPPLRTSANSRQLLS